MLRTFDPLVSRNAGVSLAKRGASSSEYIENFYGAMQGQINANDESDRLVAIWQLGSETAVSASEGRVPDIQLPDFTASDVLELGPDGEPVLVASSGALWCR